jgi:hypothetical protein
MNIFKINKFHQVFIWSWSVSNYIIKPILSQNPMLFFMVIDLTFQGHVYIWLPTYRA